MRRGHIHSYDPPLRVQVGPLDLLLQRATLDRDGRAVADVRACDRASGAPLFLDDRAILGNPRARQRLVRALRDIAPGVDTATLATALLTLSATLDDTLHADEAMAAPRPDVAALWGAARPLATAPDLLERVAATLERRGLVGERVNGLLLYLAATARLLPRPVSVIIKAPPAAGKNHLLKSVLALFPASAYVDYTAVTPRYLIYTDDDLRHRLCVIQEAGGVADGHGAYIMRSLLSDGRLSIGTAARGGGHAGEARTIIKDGPTALFTTTTRAALDGELETRALTLAVRDDPAQSRLILRGIARAYGEDVDGAADRTDVGACQALQAWLEAAGERRVRIPYGHLLAERIPCATLRIRRDFDKLLTLVAACALLHQAQRCIADDGAIEAALDDYGHVRALVAESFAAAQQDDLTSMQREAAAAVDALCVESPGGVALGTVANRLGVDKSAASRRLDVLASRGYVHNLERRRGVPGLFVPGLPLPTAANALPTVEELAAAMAHRV